MHRRESEPCRPAVNRLRAWTAGSNLRAGLLIVAGLFVLIQLVPYGRGHSNPSVTRATSFDSPRTEQLVSDACGACHSNLTSWPIESNLAPASWLIQRDVEEGRGILNFSEWDHAQADLNRVVYAVRGGEMPPLQYELLHPSSRLSDAEKADLIAGLTRTYQSDPPGP
jgi:mono/diheme cytochrome c family protein